MPTQFQRLSQSGFRQSLQTTGTVSFVLVNRSLTRSGSFSDLSEEEKYEMGQVIPGAAATLEFAVETFTDGTIKNGERVTIAGKAYRVDRVISDEVSIQLVLSDPDK